MLSPSASSSRSSQNNPLSETELIKKLEVTGMASVAAARALETGVQGFTSQGSSLLTSIQQPLPQSALVSPPSLELSRLPPALDLPRVQSQLEMQRTSTSQDLVRTSTHLQRSQGSTASQLEPPRGASQLDLQSLSIPPSPLDDADEQISKLLKTLHQQPGVKTEDEKMSDLFDSLSGARKPAGLRTATIKSPEPPVITSVKSALKSSLFNENAPSPSMPVLLPQVPLSEPPKSHDTGFQNSYLDSLAKSQIGDKRGRIRSGSGTVSTQSPTRMPLLTPSSAQTLDPSYPPHQQSKPLTVIQQNPRFEASPPVTHGPPNVTIQTAVPAPGLGMGGAGSQIRAMQHAPPNTRLVRGPNGQVTLQKVQTIELSQEMQHVSTSNGNLSTDLTKLIE